MIGVSSPKVRLRLGEQVLMLVSLSTSAKDLRHPDSRRPWGRRQRPCRVQDDPRRGDRSTLIGRISRADDRLMGR
jgi:hypothetical protein